MSEMQELVAAVREHAQAHYEQDGWDYIVEAYTDGELADAIAQAPDQTPSGAIEHMRGIVELLDDRRTDRLPMAGWDY